MATIREYFDADFNSAARVHVRIPAGNGLNVEAVILYDFSAYTAFLACYVPGAEHDLDFFETFIKGLEYGKTSVQLDGKVTLPSARAFPGQLRVENASPFKMAAQFFGDPGWVSTEHIQATKRVFIYSESQLRDDEISQLKETAQKLGHEIQFRSTKHANERSKFETPLAFISHDSRDKDAVARKIALQLQKLMCPVWYDEFSLKVGDNLRDSIERGLKSCHKCIVVLSQNFFANAGWTKKEFDSIFTREILQKTNLILPVWYGVTSEDVFAYSPSLLNVKGLNWDQLGEEEVCRKLCEVIMPA
jgi:hypothetical protein